MKDTKKLTVIEMIAQKIFESKEIAIAGHISPDGDSVSSCFAMAMSLRKLDKNVYVLLESIPGRYKYIKGLDMLYTGSYDELSPELFISCDCGSIERLGKAAEVFKRAKSTVVIDHHISNDSFGCINYIKPGTSSASELVYDITAMLGNIDVDIAAALYTGILCDTGGFRFSSTSAETMNKISKLMEYGIPFTEIYTQAMLSHTFNEVMMFSFAVSKMRFFEDKPLVYTYVTLDDMKRLNCTKEDLEGIAEYMLNTKGALVSVLVYEDREGNSKASLRSKGLNMNKIASNWGGGGHIMAAGCTIKLPPCDAVKEIINYIGERL